MNNKDYNAGLDIAASLLEEMFRETSEGETILCGIESSKKQIEIESENQYCETCNSCGETGCCAPIYCEAVKCKYGEIGLKDYECFQNQWGIMFNALKDIENAKNLFYIKDIAVDALKAVDKEWDELYGKE